MDHHLDFHSIEDRGLEDFAEDLEEEEKSDEEEESVLVVVLEEAEELDCFLLDGFCGYCY